MNALPSLHLTMTAVEWWERQHYGTGRTTLGVGTSLTPGEWIVRVNGWTPPSDFITVYGTLEAAQRAADSMLLYDIPHDCRRCGCSEWKMLADTQHRAPRQVTLELQMSGCALSLTQPHIR
jgi:hypothetical protein